MIDGAQLSGALLETAVVLTFKVLPNQKTAPPFPAAAF